MEVKVRAQENEASGMWLAGLLSLTRSLAFLYRQPRPICLAMAPSTVGLAPLHQLATKKMPHGIQILLLCFAYCFSVSCLILLSAALTILGFPVYAVILSL